MWITNDPEADFDRYDAEGEEALESLPICVCCGEHIQQEYAVRIVDDYYCDDCLDDMREWIGGDD